MGACKDLNKKLAAIPPVSLTHKRPRVRLRWRRWKRRRMTSLNKNESPINLHNISPLNPKNSRKIVFFKVMTIALISSNRAEGYYK